MTPDDEAWEAFYVNPDAVTFTRAEVRAAFMAGRVSGRADAAAQTLEQAAKSGDEYLMDAWWTASGDDWAIPDNMPRKLLLELASRARAAQYREKGKADE